MLKRTPLYDAHRAANAKMVDFGGWDMPLAYGSQLAEHHQVRSDAGVFDVSHMLPVDLEGPAARIYLQRLLANDVEKLQDSGRALYSCMLNDEGGVKDDLIVYFRGEGRYRLIVNAGTAEKDLAWMTDVRDRHGFELELRPRRDLGILAVQGPNARAKVWQALPEIRAPSEGLKPFTAAEAGRYFVARTGYTGEDGFEIVVPAGDAADCWRKLLDAGVAPIGLGGRDTLRLEAGMNLYGQDMDETTSPLESGLAWTVDLKTPRDFIGRPALESQPPRRQLSGLVLMDRGVLRTHQQVHTPHGVGEITSGGFAPTLNTSIALARLPVGVADGETVRVVVRDKHLTARVVKPPFARNGRALIDVPQPTPQPPRQEGE